MPRAEEALARAARAWIPPLKLRLSDWAESEMVLPDGVSALPGRVRLWPFQREIADAMGDPDIERVTVVKPVRVGYTTLLTSVIGNYVANDPAPILALLPTEADCRDYIVSDVEPIFEATPVLARALGEDVEEGERNTLLSRRFPGGSLKVVAAKSPRNLRRHTSRVLVIDEADGMETTNEGSPILLAERRTMSFPDRKIIMGSTPVLEETSHVLRAYAQSDMRIFEIPCPQCGEPFELLWEHIRWPEGEPTKAYAVCPHGCVIEERQKGTIVEGGRWRPTRPEIGNHAGFRLSALISLHANAAWGKLAVEFVCAKSDPTMLQTFVNTILGQGWRKEGEELDDAALADRAEPWGLQANEEDGIGPVPEDVLALTLGVDVQDDRLECTAVGWTEIGGMLVLGHEVLDGQYDDDDTWADLDQLISGRWQHALGGSIAFDAVAVDSGSGTHMPHVMAFCGPRARRRVMAIKGVPGQGKRQMARSTNKDRLWLVGVDTSKDRLFGLLRRPGSVRFSQSLPSDWFGQLTSERRVARYSRGVAVHRYERIPGRRAEALDAMIYAMAARAAMPPIDWDRRRAALQVTEAPKQTTKVKERRAPWVQTGGKWL